MEARFCTGTLRLSNAGQHAAWQRVAQRAMRYIDQHLGEDLTLADIAEAALVSKYHFARLFRAATGSSPMAYVMRARIERAKQMLRGDCGMITQVALELGFCDHSHFTRSFRRVTGHTPRDFIRSSLS